jgi:hypothetical protein
VAGTESKPLTYRLIMEDDELRTAAEDIELTDLDRASSEALLGYREILADHLRSGRRLTLKAIHIADQMGSILVSITLKDALAGILPQEGTMPA